MSVDTYYPQNPWSALSQNQRPWYTPNLYQEFVRKAIYNRFVTTKFSMNGPTATELYFDTLIMPHANHDPIGLRDAWLNASMSDSFRRKVTFSRYAGKMSYNRYDDMITFWQKDNVRGLSRIISSGLGQMMVNQMDKLARDAFMNVPFKMSGDGSGGFVAGRNFAAIDGDDRFSVDLLETIRLGLKERDVPVAVSENGGLGQDIVCITTPGAIHDFRTKLSATGNSAAFIDVLKYSNPERIINGEVGTYLGVRFVETNNAILYNAGAITSQRPIKASLRRGDGAPANNVLVDGVEYVGQTGATPYIQLDAVTGLAVNDIVTIHVDRTNANGVTNGLDFTDGKAQTRRIVSIDSVNFRIAVDRPILEDFTTDLGTSTYGYVTKARHIHAATFITGPDAVVMGVAQPPVIHNPLPIDDLDQIYRFTFDYYMGWAPFEKNGAETVFIAGTNRVVGNKV